MGGTPSTTTKAPTTTARTTTTTTEATSITEAITIQTTTVSPLGRPLESQLLAVFSSIALLLVLALASAAIYIFCWRKLPLSTVTGWLAGKAAAEADDATETPETTQHTYENVGTPAKKDVAPDVIYSEVSSRTGGHSVVVVQPDTQYATVNTSS
ncbi:hypothetical protein AALO_G00059810 [Alosa alosa]|uniref:Uncharacterized protein n=1 Tax=Alosa alosa TaxID=278164 RepID=A0AAV6H670_9TELE|nr:hypothetical protein AALO_G00059810 [Alosa alosa]